MSTVLETYQTKQETVLINGSPFYIKSLKNKQQFYDPDDTAANLGISSAMWPISGMLWPSGVVLANVIGKLSLNNLRVLEVGCGIGLASLVAMKKGADITASDYHPLSQSFLNDNASLNNLPKVNYFHGNWRKPISNRGVFDLIIGSDLLYDKDNLDILATFINCHLAKNGRIILIDPGRGFANKFVKILAEFKIYCQIKELPVEESNGETTRYRRYNFARYREA